MIAEGLGCIAMTGDVIRKRENSITIGIETETEAGIDQTRVLHAILGETRRGPTIGIGMTAGAREDGVGIGDGVKVPVGRAARTFDLGVPPRCGSCKGVLFMRTRTLFGRLVRFDAEVVPYIFGDGIIDLVCLASLVGFTPCMYFGTGALQHRAIVIAPHSFLLIPFLYIPVPIPLSSRMHDFT
jgi:hypothetical protein